jgi:cytidylate kinase
LLDGGFRAADRSGAMPLVPAARPDPVARPVVTVAAEHGAGGDLVAPRVAEALGVPFLDRALAADPEEPEQQAGGLVGRLARASSMVAGEPVERLDLDEGRVRAELAEFLARAERTGGVVLGRGGAVVAADAPGALHVLLTGPHEGRVTRVAEREDVDREDAERRVRVHDRARREYLRRTFGVDADDRALYHLIVDTVALGVDAAVALVVTATRARMHNPSPTGS